MKKLLLVLACLGISGCLGMPAEVSPVDDFELNRYLGKWYEIARLDHSFERGLENVTAEYTLRTDGGIDVCGSCRDRPGCQRRLLTILSSNRSCWASIPVS